MRRSHRNRARVIAVALPAEQKRSMKLLPAVILGAAASIAVYAIAALLS